MDLVVLSVRGPFFSLSPRAGRVGVRGSHNDGDAGESPSPDLAAPKLGACAERSKNDSEGLWPSDATSPRKRGEVNSRDSDPTCDSPGLCRGLR
jgi:hypothetical protein